MRTAFAQIVENLIKSKGSNGSSSKTHISLVPNQHSTYAGKQPTLLFKTKCVLYFVRYVKLKTRPHCSFPYSAFPLIIYRQPHSALNRENCAIAPQVESLRSRTLLPKAVRCYLTARCLTDRCQLDASIISVKGMIEKQRQLDLNSR